jgi:hypothetical protein
MPALIEKPNVHRQLVALCRENTPAAMKVIIDIATGRGYKARDRPFAAQLIIERGWGKAPMLVKVEDDQRPLASPPPNFDLKAYASEVLRILTEVGAVLPGEVRDAGVVETTASAIEDSCGARSSRLARGTCEVVVAEPIAPAHDSRPQWLFDCLRAGTLSGVDMDRERWPGLRHQLLELDDDDARAIVAAFDARF